MNEFKLEEFPESVQQLADFAVSVLKMDSGVEWTATIDVLHWDAKIILRQQENYVWYIMYADGDKFTKFLADLARTYYAWDRNRRKIEMEGENVIK